MKYPSPSEFKNNFSEEALDQMAKQARATVEIHRDWTEEMKDSFAKSTYQFFGYRALFQKYAKKAKELETNGGSSQDFQQLEQQYQTVQSEYHNIRSQFDSFKQKFDSIQIENMRLNSQVSDLQEQLEEAQTVPASGSGNSEELEALRKENAALKKQLEEASQSSASSANALPPEADKLLKDLLEALQNQQQFSSELSFLELEKNCLSEFISTIQPDDDVFELPAVQERFAANHRKISDLQEKLQQSEEQIQKIHQTLQEDFFAS